MKLNVTVSVGAFRRFGRLQKQIVSAGGKVAETAEAVDSVVEWLVTYAGADEEELDNLSFAELAEVLNQAGGAFAETQVPKTKSSA